MSYNYSSLSPHNGTNTSLIYFSPALSCDKTNSTTADLPPSFVSGGSTPLFHFESPINASNSSTLLCTSTSDNITFGSYHSQDTGTHETDSLLLFSDDDSDNNLDSEQESFCEHFHSTPKKSRESNSLQLRDPLTHCASVPIAFPLTCCRDNCLHSFSFVETQKAKSVFTSKSRLEQNQFLLDSSLMFFPSTSNRSSNKWMVEGKHLCDKAFCKILCISVKRLRKTRTLYYAGVTKATRKTTRRTVTSKSTEAKMWMKAYFHLVGDKMPHLQKTHLPQFLTRKDVYERLKRELTDQGIIEDQIIKLSTFYQIWRDEFRDVVIPAVS